MPASLDTIAFSLVMGLIGLILAYTGYDRLGLARILTRRARREPSSVAAGEEAVIESPAVPNGAGADATHEAPIDGARGLLTRYSIEEYEPKMERNNWVELHEEEWREEFQLGEGAGGIHVDGEEVELLLDTDERVAEELDRQEVSQRDKIGMILSRLTVDSLQERLRHWQISIAPGDSVLAFGTVATDGTETRRLEAPSDRDRPVVIDSVAAVPSPRLSLLLIGGGVVAMAVAVGVGSGLL